MASGETDRNVEAGAASDAPPAGQSKPDITELGKYLRGTRDVSSIAIVGLFLLAMIAFVYFAKPFLMPVVLAILFNFLLRPVVRALAQFRIPQQVGAVVVLVIFIGLISTGISMITQPAKEWVEKAPESLRKVENTVREFIRRAEQFTRAAEKVGDITKGTDETTTKVELKRFNLADTVFSYTKAFVAGAIELIVLLYFMLASGNLFLQKLLRVLPTAHDKEQVLEIAHELQHNVSTFLFTITVINTCLGVLVGLAIWFVGLPNAVLWGVVAGILNFIPYFGPFTGVLFLTLAGLLTFDNVGRALAPPIVYISLHALEANFITPMILGRRLVLNPVVIFLSLLFWTWLWGMPGALLAVPLLMVLKIFCDHFKPLASIGELLGG